MSITTETRHEAYIRKPTPRQEEILMVLDMGGEMTARQIAYMLGFDDLNAVKPRLTELKAKGVIEATRKAWDIVTGRNVAVYKRKDPAATGSDPSRKELSM